MPGGGIIIISGGGGTRSADPGIVYSLQAGDGVTNAGTATAEIEQRSTPADAWQKAAIGPGETLAFIAAVEMRLP